MSLHSVPVDLAFSLPLKLGSGLCWTLAYILILRRAWKDRSYGMPLAALGANLGWEFFFSFVMPHRPPQLQVDRVWLLFDLGLLFQTIRFGRSEVKDEILRKWFPGVVAFAVVLGYLMVRAVTLEFDDPEGVYSAFGQNLMMSVLFIAMLVSRGSARGQSIWIAILKMVGTILPSVLFHRTHPDSGLLNLLYLSILVFDAGYCLLLARRLRAEGLQVWGRL
jgi:hypothetical protein